MANTVSRLPKVKSNTGLCRSTIYALVAKGKFPKPISLGARAVAWIDEEVDAWIAERIELSRRTQGERPRTPEAR
jgi:prophage regulatory protein